MIPLLLWLLFWLLTLNVSLFLTFPFIENLFLRSTIIEQLVFFFHFLFLFRLTLVRLTFWLIFCCLIGRGCSSWRRVLYEVIQFSLILLFFFNTRISFFIFFCFFISTTIWTRFWILLVSINHQTLVSILAKSNFKSSFNFSI